MPLPMQAKLLRVLQEKRVRRVGANDEVDVDVRVVAATNRSLEALVRERRFREDLFYRLNVIPIVVPPAASSGARTSRSSPRTFSGGSAARWERPISKISEEAMERLLHHSWPGNVRELENVIERAVALETSPVVLPERLPELVSRLSPVAEEEVAGFAEGFSLDAHLTALEADLLRRALDALGWRPGRGRAAAGGYASVAPLLDPEARRDGMTPCASGGFSRNRSRLDSKSRRPSDDKKCRSVKKCRESEPVSFREDRYRSTAYGVIGLALRLLLGSQATHVVKGESI